MSVVISILIMLLILSVLTIVHEWGHFIAARIFKVKVVEFSIFMGPKLFQRTTKKGMLFSIRALPFGGYCAFEDDNGDTESPDSLNSQAWYKRAIIFVAGVTMNIVLALVLSIVMVSSTGVTTMKIDNVKPGSTAEFIGIEAGDVLDKLNGLHTVTATDESLASYGIKDTNEAEDKMDSSYTLVYKKANGTKVKYDIKKHIEYKEAVKEDGSKGLFVDYYSYTAVKHEGDKTTEYYYKSTLKSYDEKNAYVLLYKTVDGNVVFDGDETVPAELFNTLGNSNFFVDNSKNPIKLIGYAWNEMVSMVKSVYISFYWLFTGRVGFNAVSGPIGLTQVVDQVVEVQGVSIWLKVLSFINMAALISANLAVVNILPFPGLDGCHLLFIVIELIRGGKKVPPEIQNKISGVGLFLLLALAAVIMVSDIIRIATGGSFF